VGVLLRDCIFGGESSVSSESPSGVNVDVDVNVVRAKVAICEPKCSTTRAIVYAVFESSNFKEFDTPTVKQP